MRIAALLILLGIVCAVGCNKEPEPTTATTSASAPAETPKGQAQAGQRGLSAAGQNAASHVGSSMKTGN